MLDSDIGDFNCPMDIIYRIIDKEVIDLRKNKNLIEETISLGTLVADAVDIENVDRKQRQKVISIVNDYSKVVGSVNREQKDYQNVREREVNACMMKLKNMTIKRNVMHSLIQYAFERENAKIRDNLLTVLFDKDQNIFLQYFKKTEKKSTLNS